MGHKMTSSMHLWDQDKQVPTKDSFVAQPGYVGIGTGRAGLGLHLSLFQEASEPTHPVAGLIPQQSTT